MKVYDEPCAHCAITDKQLTKPRIKPCAKCSAKELPCYHWEVTDDDHLQKTQEAIDEMKSPENQFSTLFNFDPDKVDELILHLNPGEARKYKQKNNIECQPRKRQDREAFHQNLLGDLRTLGLDFGGNPEERQERLQVALEYLALKKEILQENKACKYPDALIKAEQAVICNFIVRTAVERRYSRWL